MATVDLPQTAAGTETQRSSINYRNSIPGAPKPLCRESLDGAAFPDLYTTDHTAMNPKQEQQPPALPTRSTLRNSKLLDAMSLKLDGAESTLTRTSAPHEVYLSSEEDASSSADDFSDYDFESGAEENVERRTSRKRSYEDIARAVPVVFAGKPTVVIITTSRRSTSVDSTARSTASRRLSTYQPLPPPRTISLASAEPATQHKHSSQSSRAFLDTDPFADRFPSSDDPADPRGNTSKTPSMLKKTLGLVRKRSKPFLTNLANSSQVYLSGGNPSSASIASPTMPSADEDPEPLPRVRARTSTLSSIKTTTGPVTYQDIMRNVKRNAASSPQSPAPPSPVLPAEKKSRILSGLSMSRRRSIKAG